MEHTSFSYRKFFGGNTLMIIVPHEDDEMNMAGATIYGAIQEGMDVKLVFLTNGDYEFPFEVRYNEALSMANELGLSKENLYFLGFGDYIGHEIIKNKNSIITSHSNHSKTYGYDFSTHIKGESKPYSWNGIIEALIDIILYVKPNSIIATDYDTHVDHRLCALTVSKAIEHIIKNTDYRPNYFKGFAYATGYETIDDYYDNHLQSTQINRKALPVKGYSTGNPTLSWENRIRIPVHKDCRNQSLIENPIYKGMAAHISQEAYKRGSRLINGDQVFWKQRTDNIALQASITTSSGNSNYINDFLKFDTIDIKSNHFNEENYLWIPDSNDIKRTIHIAFKEKKSIGSIQIFGSLEKMSRPCNFIINTSDGQCINLSEIMNMAHGVSYQFVNDNKLEWIDIQIDANCKGISEVELYQTNDKYEYCHILANDQFMYDWIVYPGERIPIITAYIERERHDTELMNSNNVNSHYKWLINGKHVESSQFQYTLINQLSTKPLMLRLESEDGNVFCESMIRKGTVSNWLSLQLLRIRNKLQYIRNKRKYKKQYKIIRNSK